MASPHTANTQESSLQHIYFFLDNASDAKEQQPQATHQSASTTSTGSAEQRSRTSSPGSLHTDEISETTASGSGSDMNPLADVFTPRLTSSTRKSIPPPPTATQLFELRKTPHKGFGLFATAHIPLGTLIISEESLLRITGEALHSVWGAYCRLNSSQKAAFDSLHGHEAEKLDFKKAARVFLIDPNDNSLDQEDIEELVVDQVRVMKIFSVNNFRLPPNDLGIFVMSSRLNHSCVPNVHHSYNPTLKRNTVFTVKDIQPGEELCITYIGGQGHYFVRPQRIELLRSIYGFRCDCSACADGTGSSDRRRETMAHLAWGLEEFRKGTKTGSGFIPANTSDAVKQAENLIDVMLHEGIVTIELAKAYRTASTHALHMKDYRKAVEYAQDELEVETNCVGTEVLDLKKKGVAAVLWRREVFATVYAELGDNGVKDLGMKMPKAVKAKKVKDMARKMNEAKMASSQGAEVAGRGTKN